MKSEDYIDEGFHTYVRKQPMRRKRVEKFKGKPKYANLKEHRRTSND